MDVLSVCRYTLDLHSANIDSVGVWQQEYSFQNDIFPFINTSVVTVDAVEQLVERLQNDEMPEARLFCLPNSQCRCIVCSALTAVCFHCVCL